MYYFMLQLSVADIITAVFTMLPEVLWTLFGLPVLAPGKYRQVFHTEFVLIPSNFVEVETRAIVISLQVLRRKLRLQRSEIRPDDRTLSEVK